MVLNIPCESCYLFITKKKWLYRRRCIVWSGLQRQNQQPGCIKTSGWGLIHEMHHQNVILSIVMIRSLRQVVLKSVWLGGPHISENQVVTTVREAFQSICTWNWLTLHHRSSRFYTQSYSECFADILNGMSASCKLCRCYKEQTSPTDWFFSVDMLKRINNCITF